MAGLTDIRVPDVGDFKDVEIIEVQVRAGDVVTVEQPLITLESDKASMEVPATAAGRVAEVCVKAGDKVSKGSLILKLEEGTVPASRSEKEAAGASPAARASAAVSAAPVPGAARYDGAVDLQVDLVVLGAGPGGYTAAFRAADLGLQVALVERKLLMSMK